MILFEIVGYLTTQGFFVYLLLVRMCGRCRGSHRNVTVYHGANFMRAADLRPVLCMTSNESAQYISDLMPRKWISQYYYTWNSFHRSQMLRSGTQKLYSGKSSRTNFCRTFDFVEKMMVLSNKANVNFLNSICLTIMGVEIKSCIKKNSCLSCAILGNKVLGKEL